MATAVSPPLSAPIASDSSCWSCETLNNFCCDLGGLAGRVTQSWQMLAIMAGVVYCVVQAVALLFAGATFAAIGSLASGLVLLYCASYIEQYQMVEALQQALDTANGQIAALTTQVDRIGNATTTFERENTKLQVGVGRIEEMPTAIGERVAGILERVSKAFSDKAQEHSIAAYATLTTAANQTRAEQEKLHKIQCDMAATQVRLEFTQKKNEQVSKQLALNTQMMETAAQRLKLRTDDANDALRGAASFMRSPEASPSRHAHGTPSRNQFSFTPPPPAPHVLVEVDAAATSSDRS